MLVIRSQDTLLKFTGGYLFWVLETEAGNNVKLLFMGIKEEM